MWVDASPVDIKYLDAMSAHGTQRAAAEALGCTQSSVSEALARVRKRAARRGHAPGHWNDGVAPGYRMGKVTIQRGPAGVERVWERQSPEGASLDDLIDRCEKRLVAFPVFPARPAPDREHVLAPKLINFLGLFDLHIGEQISCDDPDGRWDLAIATTTVMASIDHALAVAPKAKRMVLCFGGDAAHYDSLKPVTPRSKHVLNASGDASDMIDALIDLAYFAVERALETHDEVHLIWAAGNHDEFGALWVPKMLAKHYAAEPRLTVLQSRTPYYALRFGKVMLCVHHGHGSKLTELAGKFAAMFREMWGQATYAYAHAGHQHHIHEKEKDGLIATQHPTLAPSDDYAMSKGLVSRRGCMLITYHEDLGEQSRNTTRPEMLLPCP